MPALSRVRTCLGNFITLNGARDDYPRIAKFCNATGANSLVVDLSEATIFEVGNDLCSWHVVFGDNSL